MVTMEIVVRKDVRFAVKITSVTQLVDCALPALTGTWVRDVTVSVYQAFMGQDVCCLVQRLASVLSVILQMAIVLTAPLATQVDSVPSCVKKENTARIVG